MNRKTVLGSLLFVLLIVLVGYVTVVFKTHNTRSTYHNDEYGFSVQYPDTGWTVLDCSYTGYENFSEVSVRLFDEKTKADCQSKYSQSRISLNVYTAERSRYYERGLNSYEEKEITIDGKIYTQVSGYDVLSDEYGNPPEGSSEKIILTLFPLGEDQVLVARYGQIYHFSNDRPDIPDDTFEQEDYTSIYNDIVQSSRFEKR